MNEALIMVDAEYIKLHLLFSKLMSILVQK
ncbi:MAG: hypothetical protein K0S93_2222 [Nitrososphaeraceae archaeon]|nr:hypothetical protein [Nitrososphaeraceae archaeon]